MSFDFRQSSRVGIALILAGLFAVPGNLLAEASLHVASPSELQAATIQASRVRQQNLETVRNFISSNQAQQALRSAHLNPQQVKEAVSSLNDSELSQLAARSQKAQADFAAGTLTDRDLIIILVAVAVLILIIVAVR
jgi:hypothetical protein